MSLEKQNLEIHFDVGIKKLKGSVLTFNDVFSSDFPD
jgi:hypothetical protein